MTKKETLTGARAKTATAMAGFGGIGLRNDYYGYAFPGCLVFDELSQFIVGHTRDDAVHPSTFGLLSYSLKVSKDDNRASLFGLVDYLPTDLVADVIDLPLLSRSYFLDDAKELSLPQSLSKPTIVSPNASDLLAQKLRINTITATDSSQIPLPKVYSKDRTLIYNGSRNFSLDSQMNSPAILSPDKFSLPERAIQRNIAMRFKPQPDTTSNPKDRKFKPPGCYLSISPFQSNDISAQDKRIVPMLGKPNLSQKSLGLLFGSRIKVSLLTIIIIMRPSPVNHENLFL
ncbi:hypothetical protein HKBW3S33_00849, partial [Candidatus Hakubella thermalkaliphila]